jgi:hypothetical protein
VPLLAVREVRGQPLGPAGEADRLEDLASAIRCVE